MDIVNGNVESERSKTQRANLVASTLMFVLLQVGDKLSNFTDIHYKLDCITCHVYGLERLRNIFPIETKRDHQN